MKDQGASPTVTPVRARWQRPSGRPMWGDYEYALVVSLPDREVVFEVQAVAA
jgi:hypothetical protein